MFFADLPSEVLAQIVEFKDISYHILDLWKCGNKILNAKLASGVTYVHLETESALKWRMPLMLSELRNLRYLYVQSGGEIAVDYSIKIRKLSPTIESLHLVCWQAHNGLSDCSPGPTPDKPIYTIKDYGRGETRFYDIAAYFPRLHTLELRESMDEYNPSKNLSDLAGLPSTITHLITNSIELDAEHPKLASFLPKSLRRLESSLLAKDYDNELKPFFNDWSYAPPHLEHISKIYLQSSVSTDASWLPQSLTSVEFDSLNHSIFTPALAAALPPALGNFAVNQVDYAAFSRNETKWYLELPRQLHTLEIDSLPDAFGAGAEDPQFWRRLADLPRSLTQLTIRGFETMNWDSVIPMLDQVHDLFWPSTLSTLELSGGIPIELYHLLPPTLTSFKSFLNFDYFDEEPEDAYTLDANRLPQKLALLHLNGYWSDHFFEIKNQLPLSLTDLLIKNETTSFYGVSRESFDRIKNLTLLKRLEIDFEIPLEKCDEVLPALPLPPNIEVLVLSVWEARWISSLPRSITDLDIGLLEGVKRAVEDGLKFFLDLPPHLVNLKVSNLSPTGVVFPENAFPLLPRLRVLYISNLGQFPSSVLRVLSSTLKRVIIDVAQIQETDAPFLPPNVSQLIFRNRHLTLGNKAIDFAEYWPVRAEGEARDFKGMKFWERRQKFCPYA